jgi:lysylphosphatidylglycerol synthetase-like protein (DUF2156 family)
MIQKVNRQAPVKTSLIFLASILLLGILILAVGYYQNSKVALYFGLITILFGVIFGIFKIVIYPYKYGD